MDFFEAAAILGIDPSAGLTVARRAYLRELKSHKPERDPVGFMQLRQAYDLFVSDATRDDILALSQPLPRPTEPPSERPNAAPPAPEDTPPIRHETSDEHADPPLPPPPVRPQEPTAQDVAPEVPKPFERPRVLVELEAQVVAHGFESTLLDSGYLFRCVINRVLELFSRDAFDKAMALYSALARFTEDPAGRDPPGDLDFDWALLGELVGVAPDLPTHARKRIAAAVLDSKLQDCYDDLRSRKVSHVIRSAWARGDAPILGKIHADLGTAPGIAPRRASKDFGGDAAIYFVLAFICVFFVSAMFRLEGPHKTSSSRYKPDPTLDSRDPYASPSQWGTDLVTRELMKRCEETRPGDMYPSYCPNPDGGFNFPVYSSRSLPPLPTFSLPPLPSNRRGKP